MRVPKQQLYWLHYETSVVPQVMYPSKPTSLKGQLQDFESNMTETILRLPEIREDIKH